MAQKVTLHQPKPVKPGAKPAAPKGRISLPVAGAMLAGAVAVLGFSAVHVGRISPKNGDVKGMVKELRKAASKDSSPLPPGVDPTRGTKLWRKGGKTG